MSAIIKSRNFSALSAVRDVSLKSVVTPPAPIDEERERLRRRVAELEDEVRQHQSTAEELRAEATQAFEDGKAQGYQTGIQAAERNEAERLALLEDGIQRAVADFSSNLSSLERLSALLARDALELILGNVDYRRELLEGIITQHVSKVEKSLIVGINLSQEDFPDEESLSNLARNVSIPAIMLRSLADIPSGGCVMALRLGNQDVGITQQWGAVREMLTHLSSPEIGQ